MTDVLLQNPSFLPQGGMMAALMREHDWSASPLGAPETWPQSLRSVVGLLLGSKFPMFVAWGPELGFLYNDAYAEILGAKHPVAFGRRFRDIWPEIWPDISPLIAAALAGDASFHEDLPLVMNRRGYDEQTFFTFSYSPVHDESGRVAGLFCACTETTGRVLEARRSRFRVGLEERLRGLSDPGTIMVAAAEAVGRQLGAARAGYGEIDADDLHVFVEREWTIDGSAPLAGRYRLEDYGPPVMNELRAGKAVRISDAPTDHRLGPTAAAHVALGIRASLTIPLVKSGRLVAILYANRPEPHRWSDEDETLAREVVDRTWGAVERARAERALKAERDRAQGVLENMDEAFVLLDREFRFLDLNSEAMRLEKRPREAIIGRTHWDVHPDAAPELTNLYRKALADGTAVSLDHRYRWPDGRDTWLAMRAYPTADGLAVFYRDVTEQRLASERQRESEAHLAALFAQATVGIAETDAEGRFTRVNDRYCVIVGRSRDELLGLRMHEITHPDDLADNVLLFSGAAEHGAAFETVKRYLRPDGSTVWVHDNVTPIRGPAGHVASVLCVTVDVTKQRRAEEALRDSEARLRLGLEAGRMVTWKVEIATGKITRSADADQILGPGEEAEEFYARIPDEDVVRDRAAFQAMLDDPDQTYEIEYRYRHPDGRLLWLHNQGRAVRDASGRAAVIFGVCRDVTERREAEEALKRLNERLEAEVEARTAERNRIFALSSDLFAVMGFDGYLKVVNPAWSRLLAFTEEEILARPASLAVHPDDHSKVASLIERLRAGETVEGFENRLVKADGSVAWLSWTAVPEGDVFYAVGRDITREREREEALRQGQKMEAIGQLTGGIAHDFNNLLGAVVGGFDLIRRKPDDAERVRRWAEHGLEAAERGAKLTSQLLAFSRAQRLEAKPVIVAGLVSGMRDLLASTLGPAVRLRFELGDDGEGTAVLSDPTQLEMAVLNLAINARDAMPDGGELMIAVRRVRIDGEPDVRPGEFVELVVSDTGTGMPPEILARAFDPFFTTKGVGKGTGLGLSQVYGLARQGDGAVRIESAPGHGTAVRLLLPRTTMTPAPYVDLKAEPPPRRASILVIDDDAHMRRVLSDQLDGLDYEVREAEDGPSGLTALDQRVPDVLVVDFAMPGMNGAEVARAVRERWPNLPIVFASGYADTAAIEAVEGGNMTILRKPFRVADLHVVVADMLDRRWKA